MCEPGELLGDKVACKTPLTTGCMCRGEPQAWQCRRGTAQVVVSMLSWGGAVKETRTWQGWAGSHSACTNSGSGYLGLQSGSFACSLSRTAWCCVSCGLRCAVLVTDSWGCCALKHAIPDCIFFFSGASKFAGIKL